MTAYAYSNDNGKLKEVATPDSQLSYFTLNAAERALLEKQNALMVAQAAVVDAQAEVAIAQNRVDQALALGVN